MSRNAIQIRIILLNLIVLIIWSPSKSQDLDYNQALKYYTEIQAKTRLERSYFDSLYYSNRFKEAKYYLDSSLKLEIGDSIYAILKPVILHDHIKVNYKLGNYFDALSYGEEFFKIYSGKDVLYAKTLSYLANVNYRIFEFAIALDYHLRASEIYEQEKNYYALSSAYGNISSLYREIDSNPEQIMEYLRKALVLDRKYRPENIGQTYTEIAKTYADELEKYDTTLVYLDSAITACTKYKAEATLALAYRVMATAYDKKGNITKSIESSRKSIQIQKKLNYPNIPSFLIASNRLAKNLNKLGLYQDAINVGRSALNVAKTDEHSQIIQTLDHLFNSYAALGDMSEMKKYHDAYINAFNDFKQSEIEKEKQRLSFRHQARERASENELLKQQDLVQKETIRTQNIIIISVIIGLALVLGIALLVYRAYVTNKRLSGQIRHQAEKLQQLDAAKSRFFANISHDLRSPLTLIMGGIEQVLGSKDVFLTTKAEKQLRNGYLNGERIMHLTNEINELIKLEDGNLGLSKRYIDLDKFLRLFVSMFQSMAELKQVTLSYSKSIFDEAPIALIDPHQFEKVIFNLITNALKHTKASGSISITLKKEQTNLCISIVDNGAGIPEENLPYIFERYYQAPKTTFKTQEGFGIGLALVNEIISKHEAKIEVKSKLGEGSEFIISVALEEVAEDEVASLAELDYSDEKMDLFKDLENVVTTKTPGIQIAPSTINKEDTKKQTILVVEDHPDVREFIVDIIENHYDVLIAFNGSEALKVLEKQEVDLIVTDLMMPWFDGFELLETLKKDERYRKIPALVVSARTTEEDKNKVLSSGVNDFLCKPFNSNELLIRISNLLDKKQLWNNESDDSIFINNPETFGEIESSLLKKVESLIINRIDDRNLSVAEMADEIATSERNIYRMIKKLTGMTPFEYIKEVRFQYIQKLIKNGKIKNPSEAAKAIGMNNVSHFNSQFKKRFGKTPADMI